mgnify:CR=1 FL=1
MSDWMSVEDTSAYLKLGKTVLYSMARSGEIPANKVGNKWLFSKDEIDTWVRRKKPVENFFLDTEANIEDNLLLREPQVEAYRALYDSSRMTIKQQSFKYRLDVGNPVSQQLFLLVFPEEEF